MSDSALELFDKNVDALIPIVVLFVIVILYFQCKYDKPR